MLGKKFERQVKDRVITAASRNELMAAVEWLLNIRAAPPLEVQGGAAGPLFRLAGGGVVLFGKTTSTITARAGTTMGSGTVKPYQNDKGTLRVLTNLPEVKVWNDLGGPVASGVYVKYAVADEEYCLLTADCSGAS